MKHSRNKEKKSTNKSIFVSSTFRDMQAERDILRDFVLPHVNEFAAQYGRSVEIIDLRWGVDTALISSEEEQSRKVLRTCLDEIERSRPLFIGLIGDRYGWIPPHTEMEAALEEAHFSLENPNMSITALEIEYGVLRSVKPPACLFYFRKSPDYSSISEELRHVYQDNAEDSVKLAKLKNEILTRFGKDTKSYTAEIHEGRVVVSNEWADMVAKDIEEELRLEWGEPPETLPSWKEQEQELQDAFRKSRTEHFAGRTVAIKDMFDFCLSEESTPQILMMQGQAGSGKSGLMCKSMEEIEDKCLLLPFCCGISPHSSSIYNMLRYFIFTLCNKLKLKDNSDNIQGFRELKDLFWELLIKASKKKRVVLVVDALDQLADSSEARQMLWLNKQLPENFRLLCTIIDGPEIESIKMFGGEVRPLPSISKEDEAAIIHSIAIRHRKQINNVVVEHILQKQTPNGSQAAQNPLYLSLIIQDLVMIDRYELDVVHKYMEDGMSQPEALAKFMRKRIDETPGDAEGAYLAILKRLEKLIGGDFVRGVCGMIAVSYNGLLENDIKYAFRELGMGFNPADFSWLRQMLRGHIKQGAIQQWDFSHQSLRRALRRNRPAELKQLNEGIITAFRKIQKDNTDFRKKEMMYHLCMATLLIEGTNVTEAKRNVLSSIEEWKKESVMLKNFYYDSEIEQAKSYLSEVLSRFEEEQKHWHPKPAKYVKSGGAMEDYIDVYQFECCGKFVLTDSQVPSQFRDDGCELYKGE